jgi:hypothetical protein
MDYNKGDQNENDSILEVRLQQIDEEVDKFKSNLEDMSGLFKDES